jgi:hypothetical protein
MLRFFAGSRRPETLTFILRSGYKLKAAKFVQAALIL